MWKKHKHLFLFPAAVLGILAVCWMSGRVSEFNKWYLIIAGTVGLYCWVSELVELVRERKKEKEEPCGRGTFPFRFFILWLVKNGVL